MRGLTASAGAARVPWPSCGARSISRFGCPSGDHTCSVRPSASIAKIPIGDTAKASLSRPLPPSAFISPTRCPSDVNFKMRSGVGIQHVDGSIRCRCHQCRGRTWRTWLVRGRRPRFRQAESRRIRENPVRFRVENLDQSAIVDPNAQHVFAVRVRLQFQLMIAIPIGEKDEGARARQFRHIDCAAAIDRDRLRILERIFLKRKQRRAIRIEFVHEVAARVRDVRLPDRVGRDARRLVQLPGAVALDAPLPDIRKRRRGRMARLDVRLRARTPRGRARQAPEMPSSSQRAKFRAAIGWRLDTHLRWPSGDGVR